MIELEEEIDISEDETLCQVFVDLGQRCGKPKTQTIREPFTPASHKIDCCDDCAADFLSQGYLK